MTLFKNRIAWIFISILIVVALSIYHKPVRKVIHEKFQNPETTDSCVLDCTDKEIMHAVKRQFETNYVEGFTNPEEDTLQESFQDPSQLLSLVQGNTNLTSLTKMTGLPGVSSVSTTAPPPNLNLGAFSSLLGGAAATIPGFSTMPYKPTQLSRNKLKLIRRSLKIDTNKCEYNVIYDETKVKENGKLEEKPDVNSYIQATFVKEQGEACNYKPVEVKLLIGPQIIRYDSLNIDKPLPNIDYVF